MVDDSGWSRRLVGWLGNLLVADTDRVTPAIVWSLSAVEAFNSGTPDDGGYAQTLAKGEGCISQGAGTEKIAGREDAGLARQ